MGHRQRYRYSLVQSRKGFSLAEVVGALAILSVATYIIISMFGASRGIARDSRDATIAMDLAKAKLVELQRSPGLFEWPVLAAGDFTEITPIGEKEAPFYFGPPPTLPTNEAAGQRAIANYEGFSWRAYARLPEDGAPYAEVVVFVDWSERGRSRSFSLTSYLNANSVGGAA